MAPAQKLPISGQHFCSYCGPEAGEMYSRKRHEKKMANDDNDSLASNWEEEIDSVYNLSAEIQSQDPVDFEIINLLPDSEVDVVDFEFINLPSDDGAITMPAKPSPDPWMTWEAGELVELDLDENERIKARSETMRIPFRLGLLPRWKCIGRLVVLTIWALFVGVLVFLATCWCCSIQY